MLKLVKVFSVLILIGWIISLNTQPNQNLESVEAESGGELARVTYVIDGDTIKVELDGEVETVRYIGIDTPEPYREGEPECLSNEATSANAELVQGKIVRLVKDKENRDRYGRLLRYVYVDDVFVNEILVRDGFAEVMNIKPNTAHSVEFKKLENIARVGELGMWSACLKGDNKSL